MAIVYNVQAYYGLVCWCGVYGHGGHVAMLAMVIVSHPATGLSAVLANQPSHPVHSPAEPASLMAIHSTATAGCWRVELCVFVEMVKLAVQKKVCNGALSPLVAAAG